MRHTLISVIIVLLLSGCSDRRIRCEYAGVGTTVFVIPRGLSGKKCAATYHTGMQQAERVEKSVKDCEDEVTKQQESGARCERVPDVL